MGIPLLAHPKRPLPGWWQLKRHFLHHGYEWQVVGEMLKQPSHHERDSSEAQRGKAAEQRTTYG